jgi:hypothetical protein
METGSRDAEKFAKGSAFLKAVGFIDADRRLMLETLEAAIQLSGLESPETLKRFGELFEDVRKRSGWPVPKPISGMALPALGKVGEKFGSLEALRRAGLAAVATESYRLDHGGALPVTLEALVPRYLPTVPEDPFKSGPLRFRKLSPGYAIYSVGPDGRDDGGVEPSSPVGRGGDVVFAVER